MKTKIVIIGGGPAGLAAVRLRHERPVWKIF